MNTTTTTRRILILPLALLCLSSAAPLWARDRKPDRDQPRASSASAASDALPLREVVLFSSGVGYFSRAGEVGGSQEATISLPFRVTQVNDVLKSLVIFDASGGVRPVTFATKDAASRILDQSGVSIDTGASLGQLLRAFQGTIVRVELKSGRVEGRIISVQTRAVTDSQNRSTQFEVLNVLTEGGLRAIPLDEVRQIALLDARLNRQLQGGLSTAASATDDSKRLVQLHFAPGSRRQVRAGYLLEAPVWKTSYRLVLDSLDSPAAGAGAPASTLSTPSASSASSASRTSQPFLQGWGLIENTTDDDWKDVRLSLVSGRPISFIQDLYQPLYIPRPVVAPQIVGSPTPQLYGEAVSAPALPGAPAADAPANIGLTPSILHRSGTAAYIGGSGGRGGGFGGATGMAALDNRVTSLEARPTEDARRDLAQSLAATASQAQGSERGELFEYAIAQPVTLAKNQAAMVPIVSQAIGGERVSIYNPAASPRVLSGFRLRNSTALHLAGGPLTVFQDGVYAGDAQIGNLGPGEERLISYAVDGELVPAVTEAPQRSQTVSLSARAGVLTITRRVTRVVTYTFRNTGARDKQVLVQQPIEAGYQLASPAGNVETTADEYRFVVAAPAGQSVDFKVETQRPVSQVIALADLNLDVLISYAREGTASPALQAALQNLVAKRRAIVELQAQRARLEADLAAIDTEQNRIRQNMAQLDRQSPLYKQYVDKLMAQEKQVETARAQAKALQAQEAAAQKELAATVDGLSIE